ncbi:MAG: DEAD/DEAH box helicase [Polyangiaceae bacterium]
MTDSQLPKTFHEATRIWFERTFDTPTDVQIRAWREIIAGHDTLVAAPTGSGKTLAAFLSSVDALVRESASGPLPPEIRVVYVSPLKALSSDVEKNLALPLQGIRETSIGLGGGEPNVRAALRTGDTTASDRAAIVRNPPHILVTTPESLYLMLTAKRSRELLSTVTTVIVDEVHALMRDKRGSHLALSLARLDRVTRVRAQRVGLSATVHPIEDAARFLVGTGRGATNSALAERRSPCAIVDVGHRRALDLGVEVPSTDLGAIATHEQWKEIYDRLAKLIEANRTTLVFVNTRKYAERVAFHLAERLGDDKVGAHHGSLSKERRLHVEARLKAGDVRAIVATASLELGIDVGSVDLVCQIGSPRAMTTLLQRIGRAGHGRDRTSVGRLFPTSRDDLIECAALVRGIGKGRLDRVEPPIAPLDVLAQQIVAECAAAESSIDDLYACLTTAAPYETLTREAFDEIITMLGDGPAPKLGRGGALLHVDRVNGVVKGRRAARIIALTNGGAIPDLANFRVVLDPDETFVGTVDEDWAIESGAGDVFLLGTHSWRIRRVESRRGLLRVTDAAGAPPSIPFWLGEAPARTWEHSEEVSALRADVVAELDARGVKGARRLLEEECALGPSASEQLVAYVRAQRDALGVIPTMSDVVFERFFDESGGMQLVVHAPFGGRVNHAFGLAMRKRFCASFDFELQAAATDDAVILSIGTSQSFPLKDAFTFVRPQILDKTLQQAILPAPMFGSRWRWNATRALAILRNHNGKKVQPYLQRMRSDDLLAAVFPAQVACQENVTGPIEIPDHPLVRQTVQDCLLEAMDAPRLKVLLEKMERGEIRLHARDTTEPSPFSHETINAKPYAYLDDAPLEERRVRAVSLRRTLPETQRDLGALDEAAIERVRAEARPSPRDADELHDALYGLVAWKLVDPFTVLFDELVRKGRATTIETPIGDLAVVTERADDAARIYVGSPDPDRRADAIHALVRGHAEALGPFTVPELAASTGIDPHDVLLAVVRLETEGALLRGRFTPSEDESFCDRRLLSRIHRYTIDRLRTEIEPVTAQDFMRYLLARHHLVKSHRTGGRGALRDAIRALQGFEIAASAWESEILAPRVAGYKSAWLDELGLSGQVAWARLSPRATSSDAPGAPSRATPISLVMREDLPWLLSAVRGDTPLEAPTFDATTATLAALRSRGALFFADLVAATKLSRDEQAAAVWDLVGRGLATGDGFQVLRDLMHTGRGALGASARGARIQGRFSLLEDGLGAAPLDDAAKEARAEKVADQLLERYGVVFFDLAARESFTVPWREIARALRRKEARGLIRGGRFVEGFIGEQFALPDAVDELRQTRRTPRDGEVVRVSPLDPLNLTGTILPGPRIPAHAGPALEIVDGALRGLEKRGARRARARVEPTALTG